MKVLLIEDEPNVAGVINRGLSEKGYAVSVAPDGLLGHQMALKHDFDVIILDIMLPGINGMEVCRQLRLSKVNSPILFLTALGTTENIVAGLDAGGDDYLVKPFKFAELEARIKSLSRRRHLPVQDEEDRQHLDELVIDFKAKLVTIDEKPVSLTTTEFRLLEFFVRNRNRVVSRMEILEKVWGIDFNMGTNVVDVYVNYLRKKMGEQVGKRMIQTVIGMGYMFKA
ncbi:MAG TPA: response regulator transcription factor [Chitinophagaceae bacterium]|jgi:DNA-binding response OmpR family regulator|nr:response regulator transcription factor [Chitinophagaceae bacterium]